MSRCNDCGQPWRGVLLYRINNKPVSLCPACAKQRGKRPPKDNPYAD